MSFIPDGNGPPFHIGVPLQLMDWGKLDFPVSFAWNKLLGLLVSACAASFFPAQCSEQRELHCLALPFSSIASREPLAATLAFAQLHRCF